MFSFYIRPLSSLFWTVGDWGQMCRIQAALGWDLNILNLRSCTGCTQILLWERWSSGTRAITQRLSGGTWLLNRRKIIDLIFLFLFWFVVFTDTFSCMCCVCFIFRYDLRIRYIPPDYMKKLKEDRTFLLYFYQQVSKHLQMSWDFMVVYSLLCFVEKFTEMFVVGEEWLHAESCSQS